MLVVNTLSDVRRFVEAGKISGELAAYLERKVHQMHRVLEKPDTPVTEFSLKNSGPIGVLEAHQTSLSGLPGLPDRLDLLMPEWISILRLEEETYFVIYFVQDNDYCCRCLVPRSIASDVILEWLDEQPLEEETEEETSDEGPF